MAVAELTVTIELRRRPLWSLVRRGPGLWFKHYRVLRRTNGVVVSALTAGRLAATVFHFVK